MRRRPHSSAAPLPVPGQPPAADEPYAPFDPIPAPDAQEKSSETAWALFQELNRSHDQRFAQTVPMSVAAPLPPTGQPVSMPAPTTAPRTMAVAEPSLDDLLLEARRNNRICPLQAGWRALYALLPGKRQGPRGWEPALPNTGPGWATTGAMTKRLALRDHLQWAVDHGAASRILEFMRQLPESAWLHVGDEDA